MNLFNKKSLTKYPKHLIVKIELDQDETKLLKAFIENQVINLEEVQRIRKTEAIAKDYKILSTIASKLEVAV